MIDHLSRLPHRCRSPNSVRSHAVQESKPRHRKPGPHHTQTPTLSAVHHCPCCPAHAHKRQPVPRDHQVAVAGPRVGASADLNRVAVRASGQSPSDADRWVVDNDHSATRHEGHKKDLGSHKARSKKPRLQHFFEFWRRDGDNALPPEPSFSLM